MFSSMLFHFSMFLLLINSSSQMTFESNIGKTLNHINDHSKLGTLKTCLNTEYKRINKTESENSVESCNSPVSDDLKALKSLTYLIGQYNMNLLEYRVLSNVNEIWKNLTTTQIMWRAMNKKYNIKV
ncbi:hypothetical protein KSF78_0008508 [Schistosoma japonicum]|nr:hypothetical protein KSF78_0008508 [Schistosoma japonicum]